MRQAITINQNKYLKSVLNPWQYKSDVPDLDMTSSILKSVNITQNFLVGNSGAGLLLFTPFGRRVQVRHFIWNPTVGRYIWLEDILPDEELSESFAWGRFISGGLKVISNTTSGTLFNIQGNLTGSAYQFLPDLSTLTYTQIASYNRDAKDTEVNIPVSDGLVTLAYPDGTHEFHPFNTNGVITTRDEIVVFLTSAVNTTWNAAIGTLNPVNFATITDFPDNITGWITITLNLSVTPTGAQGPLIFNTLVEYFVQDPNDSSAAPTTVILEFPYYIWNFNEGQGEMINAIYNVFVPGMLNNITLSPGGLLWGIIGNEIAQTITVTNYDYYQQGAMGPGTLIGYDSVGEGQSISVNGILNYEVVPDSALSRQISTSMANESENPFELEEAELAIKNGNLAGFKFVDNLQSYKMKIDIGTLEKVVSEEKVVEASGFGDFFKKMVTMATPLVSNISDKFLPGSGDIIKGVSDSLTSGSVYKNKSLMSRAAYRNTLYSSMPMDQDYLDMMSAVFTSASRLEMGVPDEGLPLPELDLENPEGINIASTTRMVKGQLQGVEFLYNCVKFPVVTSDRTAVFTLYAYVSPQPIEAWNVSVYRFDDVNLHVCENPDFAYTPDIILQMLFASVVTSQPDLYYAIIAHEESKVVTTFDKVTGSSCGLAFVMSANLIRTPYFFTGGVDLNGEIYEPADIYQKATYVINDCRNRLVVATVKNIPEKEFRTADAYDIINGSVSREIPSLYKVQTLCECILQAFFSAQNAGKYSLLEQGIAIFEGVGGNNNLIPVAKGGKVGGVLKTEEQIESILRRYLPDKEFARLFDYYVNWVNQKCVYKSFALLEQKAAEDPLKVANVIDGALKWMESKVGNPTDSFDYVIGNDKYTAQVRDIANYDWKTYFIDHPTIDPKYIRFYQNGIWLSLKGLWTQEQMHKLQKKASAPKKKGVAAYRKGIKTKRGNNVNVPIEIHKEEEKRPQGTVGGVGGLFGGKVNPQANIPVNRYARKKKENEEFNNNPEEGDWGPVGVNKNKKFEKPKVEEVVQPVINDQMSQMMKMLEKVMHTSEGTSNQVQGLAKKMDDFEGRLTHIEQYEEEPSREEYSE